MGRPKKKNTREIEIVRPGQPVVHLRGLTRVEIIAERNFRICHHIVSALNAHGFITDAEAARATERLTKRFRPVIGSLMSNKRK